MCSLSRRRTDKFTRGLIGCMLTAALVVFQSQAVLAWGNEGHTYVNRVAAEKIPESMPRFLRRVFSSCRCGDCLSRA
jgi:hypothetical protein